MCVRVPALRHCMYKKNLVQMLKKKLKLEKRLPYVFSYVTFNPYNSPLVPQISNKHIDREVA